MGHSPAEIDEAWQNVKKSPEHQYISQDDPEFANVMTRELNKMLSLDIAGPQPQEEIQQVPPAEASMNAPRPHQISLTVQSHPALPSMNAPKPMQQGYVPPAGAIPISAKGVNIVQNAPRYAQPMQPQPMQPQQVPIQYVQHAQPQMAVTTSVNGYAQPQMGMHTSVNSYSHQPQQQPISPQHYSGQYSQPRMANPNSVSYPQSPEQQEPETVIELSSPSNHQRDTTKKHYKAVSVTQSVRSADYDTQSEFGAQSVMMSDISYKEKKNRIEWTHPHIIHLKDLGWSKEQIIQAQFRLMNTDNGDPKRNKLRPDDDKFLAYMINILVDELQLKPENEPRQFSDTSECIDKLYQNWICCVCCRVLTKIRDGNACCCCYGNFDPTKELQAGGKTDTDTDFTMQDNVFYFGIYVFVMTDFYCRIFPLLAFTVLLHKLEEGFFVYLLINFAGLIIALFELLVYYMMLKKKAKTFKTAIKYFWTGTFTVSYYLLSTMHLTYLPSNVRFVRMYRAHLVRMVIQLFVMLIAIAIQYSLYNDPLGFFNNSVMFFAFNWITNIVMLVWMKCYMSIFEKKLNANLSMKH